MTDAYHFLSDIETRILSRTFEHDRPAEELFDEFTYSPGACLLSSSFRVPGARFSYIAIEPFMELISSGSENVVKIGGASFRLPGKPLEALDELLKRLRVDRQEDHFSAGCLGYFSYDLKDTIEALPRKSREDLPLPLIHLTFPRIILVTDENRPGLWRMHTLVADLTEKEAEALSKKTLARVRSRTRRVSSSPEDAPPRVLAELSKDDYIARVKRVIEHIRQGDIYQACLCRRFSCDYGRDSYPLFKKLNRSNPAPWAAYLNFPEARVLSSSPELFLKCTGENVETRPMKGTRRRGVDEKEDKFLEKELLDSVKDNAELSMIVDLERNDLGKFCRAGSVDVTAHRVIQKYPSVHQTISVVTGRRKPAVTPGEVIRSTFPGGSITGCPKIRAMEVIESLEPVKRNIYTGSVGYISLHDTMQLNIAIRTMVHTAGRMYFHTGAGIVAGSDPEKEYEETMDKARPMLEALEGSRPRLSS